MDEGILEVEELAGDRVVELRDVGELHGVGLVTCEVGGVVQGDDGPVDDVAQVIGYHGVTVVVGHQEEGQEEEVEKQGEEESEVEEKLKDHYTWMECGWNEKTSASGLEPCGVMNDQTRTLKTACRCAQFCMLRMSMCVVSFLFTLSTMVSMNVLKVYLSLYTLLRSHLFVNCCIRRYSLYKKGTPRLASSFPHSSSPTKDKKLVPPGRLLLAQKSEEKEGYPQVGFLSPRSRKRKKGTSR